MMPYLQNALERIQPMILGKAGEAPLTDLFRARSGAPRGRSAIVDYACAADLVRTYVADHPNDSAAMIKDVFERQQRLARHPAKFRSLPEFSLATWKTILGDLGQTARHHQRTFRQQPGDPKVRVSYARSVLRITGRDGTQSMENSWKINHGK